jgi:hypothetical protein
MKKTNNWSNDFLDKMRTIGDPLADDAMKALWEHKKGLVVKHLTGASEMNIKENVYALDGIDDLSPEELAKIEKYFDVTESLEATMTPYDLKQFAVAAHIFEKYGYLFTSLLFFKSLPTGYLCPKPGMVLYSTGMLVKYTARRVMETAQYVFAVNSADWYKPETPGMEAIQKTRLMHAGVRQALLNGGWTGEAWDMNLGMPINQEDVALTNHLFSLGIIEGLDQLTVHLYERERRAIFHTWQKIGQAMGLNPEMYVADYDDGWKQYRAILKRQRSETNTAGPPLTKALLSSMDEITGKELPQGALEKFTLFLLDDSIAPKSLGLTQPSFLLRMVAMLLHFITGLKIWQRLFHHRREGILRRIMLYVGDKLFVKVFGLESYMEEYPDTSPIEAFSKVTLANMRKRDYNNFNASNPSTAEIDHYVTEEQLATWDLATFEAKVKERAGGS